MDTKKYLPSGQFIVWAVSLFLSVGSVYGAQYITSPHTSSLSSVANDQSASVQDTNWQAQLNVIQAQSGISLPPAPSASDVDALIKAAQQGDNTTDSVART